MDMFRLMTAGSVDDGKSTLIGRLLYDSHVLMEDQLHAITSTEDQQVNLAYITDGLKAEREQGITIDVAYRYLTTTKRKFIIADTPGHVQYTRNMVTAASTSTAALLMIDVRNGLVEQTRRHSFLASLFGIETVIVCVNKMDAVRYDKNIFESITSQYLEFAKALHFKNINFIPISALKGDNVVNRSENMSWYIGQPLLQLLENVSVNVDDSPLRLSIQHVIKNEHYQVFGGFVWSGRVTVGDKVKVLPGDFDTKVLSIDNMNGAVDSVEAMRSISLRFKDQVNISRGDLIVPPSRLPKMTNELSVTCCWLNEKKLESDERYILRIGTMECDCVVTKLISRLNIDSMSWEMTIDDIQLNDIAQLQIETSIQIPVDSYYDNRYAGSMILIDVVTGETLAAAVFD